MRIRKFHLLLLSLTGGIILSLGWPERGFPGLLFLGIIPFLFLEDYIADQKERFGRISVFLYSFPGFLAWNVLTTWWIWNSTEVGSIVAFVLNAMFMALVFQLYHFSKINRSSRQSYFILIFYWISYEYFHHNWDGNWPWLSLGNGFASFSGWIQWYEYTGIFGGTLWILITNIFIYLTIKGLIEKTINPWPNLISAVLVISIPLVISNRIYNTYEEAIHPVDIVIVQPNLDPYSQQFSISPLDILDTNLNLASQLLDEDVDYVVSPESALQENIWIGEYLDRSPSIEKLSRFTAVTGGFDYVIGASTFREFEEGEEPSVSARKFKDASGYYDAYNTAFQISSDGNIQYYHKSKLTPGVERMPFTGLFKPIESLALNLGGTVGSLGTDTDQKVFTRETDSLKVAPVICFESVFGAYMTRYIRNGAHLILVITNDGWWGDSPGYKQHFTFSKLRAIETRRSIARSANTGRSAFINQLGEVSQPTEYWEPAVIREKINANDKLTFYVIYGDYIGRISSFVAVFIILIAVANRLKKRKGI